MIIILINRLNTEIASSLIFYTLGHNKIVPHVFRWFIRQLSSDFHGIL